MKCEGKGKGRKGGKGEAAVSSLSHKKSQQRERKKGKCVPFSSEKHNSEREVNEEKNDSSRPKAERRGGTTLRLSLPNGKLEPARKREEKLLSVL